MGHVSLLVLQLLLSSWAQTPDSTVLSARQCCQRSAGSDQDDDLGLVLCLSEKQMRSRLVHFVPLKLNEQHVTISGTLTLTIQFQPDGTVSSVTGTTGNVLAIASALTAAQNWIFRPIEKKHKRYGGCGLITIKYDFSDLKQESSVQ
jgi:hypothetical protein